MMRKIMVWLLLISVAISTMLPVRLVAGTVPINIHNVDSSERQQEITKLLQAIEKIKQTKSLPDDVRSESLNDLLEQLKPLLIEEIGYISGQRDAFLNNETDETAKNALRKSFDKNIARLKEIQSAYTLEALTNGGNASNISDASKAAGVKGTGSENAKAGSGDDVIKPNVPNKISNKNLPVFAKVKNDAAPVPQAATNPVQIRVDRVPEIGDSTVGARILFIKDNTLTSPRLVISVAGSGTQMALAARELSTTNNDELVISDEFTAQLKAGNVVKYKVIAKNAANADTEIASLSVIVFPKVDATDSGLFGLLFAGLVSSRQAQTVNEAAPFMGFQIGWGSKVKGIKDQRPSSELSFSKGCDGVADLVGDWDIAFNQLTGPKGAIFQRVEDGDFNVNNNAYRLVGSAPICEVTFKKYITSKNSRRTIHPFTGRGTSRWSYRFQGLFSNEGRAAFADIPSSETLPAGQVNRRFPFIHHRESFSPEFTIWREWNPLGQFSYGIYGTLGATTVLDSNTAEDQFITDPQSLVRVKAKVLSPGGTKFFGEIGSIQHLKFDPGKFLLQNFAGFGYYEAYRGTRFNFGGSCPNPAMAPCSPVDTKTRFRFVDKFRVFPEGIAVDFGRQITMTPMFGVDLNIGAGPDNIRFFTGFAIKLKAFDGKKVDDK